MDSNLPFDGKVKVRLSLDRSMRFTLNLRQPRWITHLNIKINNNFLEYEPEPGTYLDLDREWKDGDVVELKLGLKSRFLSPHPKVRADQGRTAIMRGPLVYCIEDKDNPGQDVHRLSADTGAELTEEYDPGLLQGVMKVMGKTIDGRDFIAVPYYAWANRGPSDMEVWIKK